MKPRLQTTTPQKQCSADDWQHPPSPKPIKITTYNHNSTNKKDSPTANTQTTPPSKEDLYDLLKDAPDNYRLRSMFEPETETETQNQQPTISRPQETQTDQLKVQSTSTTQTDDDTTSELTNTLFSASPGKQPLLDADVFNYLTTDEGNNVAYLKLSTNLTLERSVICTISQLISRI